MVVYLFQCFAVISAKYHTCDSKQLRTAHVSFDWMLLHVTVDEPDKSSVSAYWEDDDTMLAAISTPSEVYVIEVSIYRLAVYCFSILHVELCNQLAKSLSYANYITLFGNVRS